MLESGLLRLLKSGLLRLLEPGLLRLLESSRLRLKRLEGRPGRIGEGARVLLEGLLLQLRLETRWMLLLKLRESSLHGLLLLRLFELIYSSGLVYETVWLELVEARALLLETCLHRLHLLHLLLGKVGIHALEAQVLQTLTWRCDLRVHVRLVSGQLGLQWWRRSESALLVLGCRGRSLRGRCDQSSLALLLRSLRSHPWCCDLLRWWLG